MKISDSKGKRPASGAQAGNSLGEVMMVEKLGGGRGSVGGHRGQNEHLQGTSPSPKRTHWHNDGNPMWLGAVSLPQAAEG